MPIRYYEGVEGAGKSCMMTKDLFLHYKSGGRVLALPGYELRGNTKRQVLSELCLPEQIMELLKEKNLKKQRVAIAMDEVSNFFNHHSWWNKINDVLEVILAERRKLGVAVAMTGPMFGTLPPDIRNLIHEIVHCTDNHSLNHAIPRGQKCIYYKEDLRGLLSHPRRNFSHKKVFFMPPWYKHFDTWAPVDFIHQFTRIKFKGREVVYDSDGNVINDGLDKSNFENILNNYQAPAENPKVSKVKEVVKYLKDRGKELAETQLLCDLLGVPHVMGRDGIGSILNSLGAIYKQKKKIYDLSGIDI